MHIEFYKNIVIELKQQNKMGCSYDFERKRDNY